MLLKEVWEQVDQDGAKVFVQASKEGMGLYERFGWVEVDEILMDFSRYGGEKNVRTSLMIREPQGGKGV